VILFWRQPSRAARSVWLLLSCAAAQAVDPSTTRPASEPDRLAPTGNLRPTISVFLCRDGFPVETLAADAIPDAARPGLCALPDGSLLAVFHRATADAGHGRDGLAHSRSRDGGRTWSAPQPIRIRGLPAGGGPPQDPAPLAEPDGRVRLYFTLRPADAPAYIASASSDDGPTYRLEPGERLRRPDAALDDPIVLRAGTETHLFARAAGRPDVLIHARSLDGLEFQRAVDVALVRPERADRVARWRAVVASRLGPRLLASPDGRRWTVGAGGLPLALRDAASVSDNTGALIVLGTIDRRAALSPVSADAGAKADSDVATPAPPAPLNDARPASNEGSPPATDAPAQTSKAESAEAARPNALSTAARIASWLMPAAAGRALEPELDPSRFDDDLAVPIDPRIEALLAPEPDSDSPVDYLAWLRQAAGAPADDAAPYYSAIITTTDAEGRFVRALPPFTGMLSDVDYNDGPRPWSPHDRPAWEADYERSLAYVARFRAAAAHTDYATPIRFSPDSTPNLLIGLLLPDLAGHRALVKQTLSNSWRLTDGRVDAGAMIEAWQTSLAAANHMSRGVTIIEDLVGVAERGLVLHHAREALHQGLLSPDQVAAARAVLLAYPAPADPPRWVAGESAFAMDMLQNATARGALGGPVFDPGRFFGIVGSSTDGPPSLLDAAALTQVDPAAVARDMRRYYAQVAQLAHEGYPRVRSADFDALADRHRGNPVARSITPSLGRFSTLRARAEASRRATGLAYEVAAFQARHGRPPDRLDELPAEQIAFDRIDPFSGRDFGYRLGPDGPIIYSVSENARDDGGVHAPRWGDDAEAEAASDDYVFWPPQPPAQR